MVNNSSDSSSDSFVSQRWFWIVNGVSQGPVDGETFFGWVSQGLVARDVLVWRDGLSFWTRVDRVSDFVHVFAQPEYVSSQPSVYVPLAGSENVESLFLSPPFTEGSTYDAKVNSDGSQRQSSSFFASQFWLFAGVVVLLSVIVVLLFF